MEHLSIKDLYYTYERSDGEKIEALKGLDLTVHAGEFIAILGHNGSGKSTLARLLNGLLEPLSGDVEVMGMNTKDGAKIFEIRRALGLVFQNPDNQMVATVVEEDVAFGPENLGLPSEEIVRRVDHALKLVEMEHERMRAPHLLSGGQKQRVAIAGILAIDPEIIVLDEPTAMLDPVGRREIMRTLKRLHEEEKKTIVLITHFMEEAILAFFCFRGHETRKIVSPEKNLGGVCHLPFVEGARWTKRHSRRSSTREIAPPRDILSPPRDSRS